jgi:hypothetical protein
MHWCADETTAVINMLSTVDVVWAWLRSALGRLLRPRARATATCECHREGGQA